MKIAVLGSGTWGTALAQLLVDNKQDVIIYGIAKDEIDDININHRNSKFFADSVVLPSELKATMDLKDAILDAAIIILAVPTIAIRETLNQIKPLLKNKPFLVSVAKGFDVDSHKRMSEIIREIIPENLRQEVVSLIGPGHAEEVILRMLTLCTSTSIDLGAAKIIQNTFSNDYFRVYTQTDEIGAEYGVAIKNAIAIASGIVIGLGYGDNAKAALVTRGLNEMVRFGLAMGGEERTYLGLTGLGDLMVTCNSIHSRNFQAGLEIGKANSSAKFLKSNKKTVEGIRTAKIIHEIATEKGIDMPIVNAVYDVLYNDVEPKSALINLMKRKLKPESV